MTVFIQVGNKRRNDVTPSSSKKAKGEKYLWCHLDTSLSNYTFLSGDTDDKTDNTNDGETERDIEHDIEREGSEETASGQKRGRGRPKGSGRT